MWDSAENWSLFTTLLQELQKIFYTLLTENTSSRTLKESNNLRKGNLFPSGYNEGQHILPVV